MNKNYIKSLINEMFDQNILNSEDDRDDIKGLIWDEGHVHGLTGNFEEDLEYLKEVWEKEGPCDVMSEPEEEENDPTQDIDEIVNNLKVGFNFVPGIGVGYCSNQEDLEAMKNFVRGGMTVRAMFGSMFGF